MKRAPGADGHHLIHWSYVGAGVPWQRTPWWQPPARPDRIAALDQRLATLEALTARLSTSTAAALESLRARQ
jgi:hypothetical protein